MGLAPFGNQKYANIIEKELIDIKNDGSFTLNQKYFNFATGFTMINSKFSKLFDNPPRKPETEAANNSIWILLHQFKRLRKKYCC